jgi:hypothetical protein
VHVVDAAFELVALPKVVYPDEEGFATAGAGGVAESVVGGGAVAEGLRGCGGAGGKTGRGRGSWGGRC